MMYYERLIKNNTDFISGKKWLLLILFLMLSLSVQDKTYGAELSGDKSPDSAKKSTAQEDVISFENEWVETGVPLKVIHSGKDSVFQWTITAADGTERSFTTTENLYTPSEEDRECLITVSASGQEGGSASIYFSSLPVVYIDNEAGYYGVQEEFTDATMVLQGNKAFHKDKELYLGDIGIKLRGNSTKWRDKRPFNIKLSNKTDLLGMGKNKHWALLANDIDHTLMRNKLLYDFSGAIGMDTYTKSENVVLIFNNQYYGVYQLCELIDLGSNRVDIYDWEESAEKAAKAIVDKLAETGGLSKESIDDTESNLEEALCENLSWITKPNIFSYDVNGDGVEEVYNITDYIELPDATGGVLTEMDFYAFDLSNPSTMITAYSQPLYFKSPEYAVTNPTLFDYTKRYIQSFEYALHSSDFIYHDNASKYEAVNRKGGNQFQGYTESSFSAPEFDGKHYSQLFDMNSLIQNFLVCEFSMNWDSMKNSVFLYKDIDGLFHMGPEWDFDWSWGNINMYNIDTWYPTSWQTTSNTFAREQYYQTVQWNRSLIRDPYFLVRLFEKYREIRGTVIEDMIKDGGTIDTYAEELRLPAAANDARWNYSYVQYRSVGFEASIENMKKFISARVSWLDEQFEYLDTMINSLGYYKASTKLKVVHIDNDTSKEYAEVTVYVTASDIAAVNFQVNGTHMYTSEVSSGKASCRIPASALISDQDILNVVQILAVDKEGKYIIASQEEGDYSLAESNYAVFQYNNEQNNTDNKESGSEKDSSNQDSNGKDISGKGSKSSGDLIPEDIYSRGSKQEVFAPTEHQSEVNRIYLIIIATAAAALTITGIVYILKVRKK